MAFSLCPLQRQDKISLMSPHSLFLFTPTALPSSFITAIRVTPKITMSEKTSLIVTSNFPLCAVGKGENWCSYYKNRIARWVSNFILGNSSEKYKNTNSKRVTHPVHKYVHCGNINNSQDMETTLASTYRWMNTEDVIYIYTYMYTHTLTHPMKYYSAIKKNEILPFLTTWVEPEGIMLSQIS